MQSVHDVCAADFIRTCYIDILAPCRCADDNYCVVVVVADGFDHVSSIVFDVAPVYTVWLIADFVKHMGFLSMFLRHVFPEVDSVTFVSVGISWIQHVPVDKAIDASLSAVVHILVDPLSPAARVGNITLFLHIHGKTEDGYSPVFYKDIQ